MPKKSNVGIYFSNRPKGMVLFGFFSKAFSSIWDYQEYIDGNASDA